MVNFMVILEDFLTTDLLNVTNLMNYLIQSLAIPYEAFK